MGNMLGDCCSTDKNGHEETSKIIAKNPSDKKKSRTYLIDSEKLQYLDGNHLGGGPSSHNKLPLTQMAPERLTNIHNSSILDRADSEANCKMDTSQIKENEKSRIDFQEEDDDNHFKNMSKNNGGLTKGLLQGKRGLMVDQSNFAEHEVRDVFT